MNRYNPTSIACVTRGPMVRIRLPPAASQSGTALGAKLADITSANGNVTIMPTSNYLFFVADNTTTSGADVLLHTLTVTPNAVPEPATLALLCTALLGAGLLRRRGLCADLA